MKVQHNMLAMYANRQCSINTNTMSKVQEKLSSGYRINRSADDAAGLSISEKMRRQIRGLDRTLDNMQDGISLCQAADGALAEVHEILQRMNELAIQAANGTNSHSDREAIQNETDELVSEIDRIAYNTKIFEIHPLLGDAAVENTTYSMPENAIHALKHAEVYDGLGSIRFMAEGLTQPLAGTWTDTSTKPAITVKDANGHTTGKINLASNGAYLSHANYPGQDKFVTSYNDGTISFQVELTWKKVDCSTESESREYFEFSYNFINRSASELTLDFWVQVDMLVGLQSNAVPDINGTETPNTVKWTGSRIPEEMSVDNYVKLSGSDDTEINVSAQYKWDGIFCAPDIVMSGDRNSIGYDNAMNPNLNGDLGNRGSDYFYGYGWSQRTVSAGSNFNMQSRIGLYAEKIANTSVYEFKGHPPIWIQMGADAGVGMSIKLCNATALNLGVHDINMLSEKSADAAINKAGEAIQKVSAFRSYFGVQQNRLEHAVKINANVVENTQAAESLIRDADMADTMVQFSAANIVSQVSQSMLAHANQDAEMVLQLLK